MSATLINNSLPIIAAFNVLIHIFCGLGIAKDIPKVLDRRLQLFVTKKYLDFSWFSIWYLGIADILAISSLNLLTRVKLTHQKLLFLDYQYLCG